MGRVISTDRPGNTRSYHRRTIAEALRRLSQKPKLDEEAKDLAAVIVVSMLGIAETIDQTLDAWEKRDYYMKAERFREQWRWLEPLTDQLSGVIYEGQWEQLPDVLIRLMPHFSDVTIKQLTRSPEVWEGAYTKLMAKG
ncbi:MAG: hypothetical protein GX601_18820 [Anaerolineales bacterium]|nr:hypothetical protein [Anaerolineales bacterium]